MIKLFRKTCKHFLTLSAAALALLHAAPASSVQYKVLFLGNSYTATNELPVLTRSLAVSAGDELSYASYTPGGYTFENHCQDANARNLIMQGGWDYVVLQEQSQKPSFPDGQVASSVYPYAKTLDSLVKVYNPCARTVFYMTWGRKNGDQDNCPIFPPLCTYIGMDSLLQLRYNIMAENNQATISPVAKVWRRLRNEQPNLELYDGDQSHPSVAGTFAAACSFYSVLFRKNPEACSFNATLSASDAATIKQAAKKVVFDSLDHWYRFEERGLPGFTYAASGNTVNFTSTIQNASSYAWTFGDGGTANTANPAHTYTTGGSYTVKLVTGTCADSTTRTVMLTTTGIETPGAASGISVYPNPAQDALFVTAPVAITAISIYDAMGRLVQTAKAGGNTARINVSGLSSGTYQLLITSGKTQVQARFSKR